MEPHTSWDDWVPQDRLRKFTEENKELAKSLKKEKDSHRQRTAPKAVTVASKKKAAGSDLSSNRGSEERHSSVPVTGRGQKRGRDYEIEKVGRLYFSFLCLFLVKGPKSPWNVPGSSHTRKSSKAAINKFAIRIPLIPSSPHNEPKLGYFSHDLCLDIPISVFSSFALI